MIIIPEITLKNVIDVCLETTIEDYEEAEDKSKTFLYKIFKGLGIGSYDYYKNAVALLTRTVDHPRHIETHFFFNRERFSLPTIHINLPAEDISEDNGIGFDFGFNLEEYDDPDDPEATAIVRTRSCTAKYNVVFTSDSTFEVLIMFYWLKACLIGNVQLLELSGLYNVKLSANDLMLDDTLAPSNVYARALQLQCNYNLTAPMFNAQPNMPLPTFVETPVEPEAGGDET